ncbi:MAG: Coenzyme F420 hydrogenase/dehydrogenase, beta subunit C-terminal domain [Pseudomonadota bacterium]
MKTLQTPLSGQQIAPSASLTRVDQGDLCAGCGGCAGRFPHAIMMAPSHDGFARPVQIGALSPKQDAELGRFCPGLGQRVDAGGRTDDPLWGPYVTAWTGHATDPDQRHAGASGGTVTALCCALLASGEVDAIVHVTADPARPMANATVISETAEGVLRGAGSRYAPSSPLEILPDIMRDGRRFAVVGKPCDAAALAALRADDPVIARAVPVILSFFCAGVPSSGGARGILNALAVEEKDVASFRYRGQGWPGQATATLRDGSARAMSYHESWGGILSKHVQHRCKICADGTGMAADLVCADAWEADQQGYPVFEERPGISLVLARTHTGRTIAERAHRAGHLSLDPYDMAQLARIQPGQRERRRALWARLAALKVLRRPVPDYQGLHVASLRAQNPKRRNLKNFLGTLRRALRG